MMMKRLGFAVVAVLMTLLVTATVFTGRPAAAFAEGANGSVDGYVYVIPVKQEIDSELQRFMERAFAEAHQNKAGLILLTMDTPGGHLTNAEQIGALVESSKIPTAVFIQGKAASAGSYIALNADKIMMTPGSVIGAAALVDGSGKLIEDPKLIGHWSAEMQAAAEANGRNKAIAAGMVEVNAVVEMKEINKTKQKGEIISLTAAEALQVGFSDKTANSLEEALQWLGASPDRLVHVELTFSEKLAAWLTSPVISTLLLFLGIAGVAIELIVPGFGVPGIVGLLSFGLYFFGNYAAGFAKNESLLLFIVGIVLLVCELFIPSFGILGILGSVSLIAGVVTAAYSTSNALVSLSIAFAAALVVVIIFAIVFKRRGVWNRFILKDQLTKDAGYIPAESKESLLHKEGISVTPLRPAGSALIDDERIDVVTDGTFVQANKPIIVVKVEGTRIVVKERKE
ncbi:MULTISPECIES: nodulation protein NfeD [unclassified Paenibacillus]|uniref:NfeD family protein n=1 Tax=unclassified Paenibacillus TaxID=185978 RepID=UPI001E3AAA4E|nr:MULTISPECIES: nodulation protein NfeD [unclassified Paenibacillus]